MKNEEENFIVTPETSSSRYDAIVSGRSFGLLIKRNNPDWNVEEARRFISDVRPKGLLITWYQQSFINVFRYEKVLSHLTLEERLNEMSFINELEKETSSSGWITAQELADEGAIFGVLEVKAGNGSFGEQWIMLVDVREDTINGEDFDIEDLSKVSTSLPCGSRDKMMERLAEKVKRQPQYNCYIEVKKTGRTKFFRLGQLDEEDEGYEKPPRITNSQARRNSRNNRRDEDEEEDEEEKSSRSRNRANKHEHPRQARSSRSISRSRKDAQEEDEDPSLDED